jgi:LysM repeat protein/ABC-type branched-subunit amino acid transport system substrate-binding protein
MKISVYQKFLVLLFLLSNSIFSQVDFKKHVVKKSENLYRISVKYDMTIAEIISLNPDKAMGVVENDILFIPNAKVLSSERPVIASATTHIAKPKETLYSIARDYKVAYGDLRKLNEAELETGLKIGQSIKIPQNNQETPILKSEIVTEKPVIIVETPKAETPISSTESKLIHIAKPKETLYSIARDYKVAFTDLKKLNENELVTGLKIGQAIKIPGSGQILPVSVEKPVAEVVIKTETSDTRKVNKDKTTTHIVAAKETKFGISKKYGMSVSELEDLNPAIVSGLPIGFKLIVKVVSEIAIPTQSEKINEVVAETPIKVEKPKPVVVDYELKSTPTPKTGNLSVPVRKKGMANYEVKPKETLYGLSQTLGITPDELIELNPTLKDGVKVGMILVVPGKGSSVISNSKYKDLTKTIQVQERKKLALLLPFNATKIQNDTINTAGSRLKKDAFLNMTLDFYSGVLMAIDYGKALGLNIDVKILDSQESKISSNIADVIKNNNLDTMDAVIGPFYQQYAEQAAELLKDKNVPVISPLSKEVGKSLPNLYQSMPPADYAKAAIFDFMLAKKGNIIVVSDVKRQANKDFIIKNYSSALFAGMTTNGSLDIPNFKSLLKPEGINYVVLDTEKTGMILATTNMLMGEMKNFQIQLVIIEPNETLNFEEISMKRLTVLKLLYPSLTRDSNSQESILFETDYKKKNKILPNQFATRGFDITFDTMLRLSQNKTFAASINDDKTEQLESKFEYQKKDTEGYINKGVYILEYQEDLTVKAVN